MKKFAIKCRTIQGNTLFFCHQYLAGTKQNVFVSNINQALFYYEYQIGTAEIELIKLMKNYGIKSYTIEIL
jgi:hypothetical protein